MNTNRKFSIKPAGRHILTIGRDLIQDQYAAIVELVKNAYDADSSDVNIIFKVSPDKKQLTITIEDHGHGMSRDTVIGKWLVPSTDDKMQRKTSPNGRTMQGRKGVGRYAASILGDDLLLETVTPEGEKTIVYIEWRDFQTAEYLDDVEILVDTESTDSPSGTILTIKGGENYIAEWTPKKINNLRFELKKLIPPFDLNQDGDLDNNFSINITLNNLIHNEQNSLPEKIEPYPIFQLYDYKIAGYINNDGTGSIKYTNQRAKNTLEEVILVNLNKPTGCGSIIFDISIYDRDPESIDYLIKRGLKDSHGNYVGKLEARELLNTYNGIGVYRNGFRIRPLGDPGFDWLELNKRRVQNPSLRIGSDQAIGYIQIQSEELSNLEEKSARDGLKVNSAYNSLIIISKHVINELESRRFEYRTKSGIGRRIIKLERDLEKIFRFDEMKKNIRTRLVKQGIDSQIADEVINIINQKEDENNRIAEDIRNTVAIYQGQATLGKIINVILHEGRRPLNFFKNQIPTIAFLAKKIKKNFSQENLDEFIPITEGLGSNAQIFVNLFSRLDPLAAGKRGPKRSFNMLNTLNNSFMVFENELNHNNITFNIDCPTDFMFTGWYQDIYIIMTNLIDNSIFWINEKYSQTRHINITVFLTNNDLDYIDYRDTGPGIAQELIESEVIFEPEFTTKEGGYGLGLAIAGEAASRNGLELKVFSSEPGAYFRLQIYKEA